MKYTLTFCDPLKKDIIALGDVESGNVVEVFNTTKWNDFLSSMENKKQNEIFWSPSLEIYNPENKNGLSVSAVGKPNDYKFYVFYKRPKVVKSFLGLTAPKLKNDYVSSALNQTAEDTRFYLTALLNNNLDYLEEKIK